jgi:hypothetical protein
MDKHNIKSKTNYRQAQEEYDDDDDDDDDDNNKQFIPCECCSQVVEFVYSSKLFCKLVLL